MLFLAAVVHARACGPFFPNNLLAGGDKDVLTAPLGDFEAELERMQLGKSRFKAVPAEGGHEQQAAAADAADLASALRREKTGPAESLRIRNAYELNRALLQNYVIKADTTQPGNDSAENEDSKATNQNRPAFPTLTLPEGLPGEFRDYFEGAMAWHNRGIIDKTPAREAWERLLARPEAERKFKSTWAAYMLGRYWETNKPVRALEYFSQVRQLASRGFADTAGLATASIGREARVEFQQKNYLKSIQLYLDQLAAGDASAVNSLKFVSAGIFAHPEEARLEQLAKDPQAQRVLTAYIISQRFRSTYYRDEEEEPPAPGVLWLKAVESAGVKDLDSAEKLALAAYQENQMETAARWIKRAPNSPVSQWISAKLLLREGKLNEAARALSRAVQAFPDREPPTNHTAAVFADHLAAEDGVGDQNIPAYRRVRAELGVLQLSRSEYVSALDSLMQARYWADAAYVAERVLTTDELKSYVDRCWPVVAENPGEDENTDVAWEGVILENTPRLLRVKIRHLLARRLTRELRGNEALEYYPDTWKPAFRILSAELLAGWDESKPGTERARALFRAACITRTNGMELLGTELQPDYAIYGGDYEYGPQWQERATNENLRVLRATTNEIQRASHHNADPEQRFHHRYQAAFLAWEAAKLMPNDSDETARMLWAGGTWLKYRDPETADLFYKALVNRNRHTALGAEADRQRWFPRLDENGHPLPLKKPLPEASAVISPDPEAPEEAPVPEPVESAVMEAPPANTGAGTGYDYTVQVGDTLARIAARFSTETAVVTTEDIGKANPDLQPSRLRVGQKISIPVPSR